MKTITKINRMKIVWFIRMSMCILFIFSGSEKIFANRNILEDPQDNQVQYPAQGRSPEAPLRAAPRSDIVGTGTPDSNLFQDLVRVDDESLDIARISLLIAKEENPEIKINDYLECIDWYVKMIEPRISDKNEPKLIIEIINDFLFDELGFAYVKTGNLEDLYLNDVIDKRRGNCVGMSILYLAIAERLQLPLFGVNVPGHIFIRYDNGETKINIETGHEGMSLSDSFYVTHSIERFDKGSVENGCYLRNLTKKEVISNVFLNRSKIRREDGALREALSDCNKAILLKPEEPEAYCNKGVIYEKIGMIPKAIENYGKAISLNRKYASAYYNRGSVFGAEGIISKAIEDLNKAISINPDVALSYYNRAIAFKKIGQVEKAIQDYDKAIDIDPDFAQAYCNRGVAFAETGKFDNAIDDLDMAIRLDPNLGDAYFARAIFFADVKKFKKAIEDFGKCIGLSPDKTFAYYLRGKSYKETGETEKAVQDFNKAITIRPSYAGLYVDRGILLFQTGMFDEAIIDFDKSLELFPGNPIAFRYRGKSFEKKGQLEKAIEDFESFLRIVPDSPDANVVRNEIRELTKP